MLATPATQELERAQRTTPLAVRFWDLLHEHHANDGLLVTATAVDVPSLPRIGLPNRTGGFGFRTLPGLRDSDFGVTDSPFWASPPVHREYLIRMTDTQERFLPIAFRAAAPHPGWFAPPCERLIRSVPGGSIPLLSSPSRSVGPGAIAVRAELWDLMADGPAAWALVQVRATTEAGVATAYGLSDQDGRMVAAFPHADAVLRGRARSSGTGGGELSGLTWSLEFAFFYQRLPGGRFPPELGEILCQPRASVVAPLLTESLRDARELQFGIDFHIRSSGDSLGRVLVRHG